MCSKEHRYFFYRYFANYIQLINIIFFVSIFALFVTKRGEVSFNLKCYFQVCSMEVNELSEDFVQLNCMTSYKPKSRCVYNKNSITKDLYCAAKCRSKL